jgi:gas vesicle protein
MSYGRTEERDIHAGFALLMLVAGALVGAAAALVLAPTTGRDARNYIGRRGRAIADDVTARSKKVWEDHGTRIASAVKREYSRATGSALEQGHGLIESAKPM